MKPRYLLVLILMVFAGCGTQHHAARVRSVPSGCVPSVPARMGVCVEHRFGAVPLTSVPSGARGVDISVYQGYPSWGVARANGLRFVYNQAGDGAFYHDPNFAVNTARERGLGILNGAYLFLRPGSAFAQASSLVSRIRAAGGIGRLSLPPVLDAEVPGAYGNLCAAAGRIRSLLHTAVLTYVSPGLWPGGAICGTGLWAAIWGGRGYAFGGWSTWLLQQVSGSGRFAGVSGSVDLDVDHGLLARAKPVPPTRAELHRELLRDYGYRRSLRGVIARKGCRKLHPHSRRCEVWRRHGAQVNKRIRVLHARHIY